MTANALDTNINDNVSVPDLIKRIRLIGGQGGDPSSQGPTQPPVSSPDNNVPTPIASAVQPTGPSDVNLLKAPLASQYRKDQEQRQVESDTVAPPSEIAQAAIAPKVTPPVPSALQGAMSEPEPGKGFNKFQAALAKIRPFLPVAAAIGGGLEAAGSPNHEAPNAARLLQAEQNAAQRRIEQEKVGIEQQQANTEAQYKGALSKQYGLEPYTYNDANGNPVTIFVQQKDLGRVGSAGVTQAGQATKQQIANAGREAVERIRQGGGVLVDPEFAKLAGQPQLAGQYVNGQTLKNYISILNSKGIHIQDLGNEGLWAVDKAGNRLKQVSVTSPSVDRAAAYARARAENTPVDVFDENGNLTDISQAQQLRSGIPKASTVFSEQGPTAATRNMSQLATTVTPHLDVLRNEIKELSPYLGPVMGRWDQFLAGKIGSTGNPDLDRKLGELRSDLKLASSAVGRTHFAGRTGLPASQYFESLFNMANSPEQLEGILTSVPQYIEGYAGMANFTPTHVAATAPARPGRGGKNQGEGGGGGTVAPEGTIISVNGQQQIKRGGKWVPYTAGK